MEADFEPVEIPQEFDALFNEGLLELSPEDRLKLALGYIDKFSRKKADSALIKAAGIDTASIDPEHVSLAKIVKRSEELVELETRMNYCQYLTQPQEQPLLLYTRVKLVANIDPENIKEINPDEDIRTIKEPFFADKNNMVRQYSDEDKGQMVRSQQIDNQVAYVTNQKRRIPSVQRVGVIYFKPK